MVAPRKENAAVEKVFTDQRRRRALALAGLMSVASRDAHFTEELDVSGHVQEGLVILGDELLTDLAELLGLTPPHER